MVVQTFGEGEVVDQHDELGAAWAKVLVAVEDQLDDGVGGELFHRAGVGGVVAAFAEHAFDLGVHGRIDACTGLGVDTEGQLAHPGEGVFPSLGGAVTLLAGGELGALIDLDLLGERLHVELEAVQRHLFGGRRKVVAEPVELGAFDVGELVPGTGDGIEVFGTESATPHRVVDPRGWR